MKSRRVCSPTKNKTVDLFVYLSVCLYVFVSLSLLLSGAFSGTMSCDLRREVNRDIFFEWQWFVLILDLSSRLEIDVDRMVIVAH